MTFHDKCHDRRQFIIIGDLRGFWPPDGYRSFPGPLYLSQNVYVASGNPHHLATWHAEVPILIFPPADDIDHGRFVGKHRIGIYEVKTMTHCHICSSLQGLDGHRRAKQWPVSEACRQGLCHDVSNPFGDFDGGGPKLALAQQTSPINGTRNRPLKNWSYDNQSSKLSKVLIYLSRQARKQRLNDN